MIIAILVLLGLCFGSFVNALVWRLHQQSLTAKKRKASDKKLSLSQGRSMCVNCGHTLQMIDLVPVLSWISLKGKCRYCKQPISGQYPVVELLTALLFVVSYSFWPEQLIGWELISFGLWLVSIIGFMALAVYDLRWMLLPNKIIFPLYGVAAVFVFSRVLTRMSGGPLLAAFTGVTVGGGIFYLLFRISDGKWIGGGDVKLGFLLGALVGGPLPAALVLFIASLIGTVLVFPLMILKKTNPKTRIPFGPLLIAGAFTVQLYGQDMINAYRRIIGL